MGLPLNVTKLVYLGAIWLLPLYPQALEAQTASTVPAPSISFPGDDPASSLPDCLRFVKIIVGTSKRLKGAAGGERKSLILQITRNETNCIISI